ncbi:MAG: hypothetical protein SVU32_05300 [Candidatus Nanohaloarchaea archaeon]|nr:hypothetical protein [Candidatus Nanohaloarchaea archaeon]
MTDDNTDEDNVNRLGDILGDNDSDNDSGSDDDTVLDSYILSSSSDVVTQRFESEEINEPDHGGYLDFIAFQAYQREHLWEKEPGDITYEDLEDTRLDDALAYLNSQADGYGADPLDLEIGFGSYHYARAAGTIDFDDVTLYTERGGQELRNRFPGTVFSDYSEGDDMILVEERGMYRCEVIFEERHRYTVYSLDVPYEHVEVGMPSEKAYLDKTAELYADAVSDGPIEL